MSQEIILRRATLNDVDKILEVEQSIIDKRLFTVLVDKNEARKEAEEDITNHFVYLVIKDGEFIGTISYELKDKNHAYLFGVVIFPKFQGKGFAKQATVMILKKLEGIELIDLVTHPENEKALNLYGSLGFKTEGEPIENYFGDGEPRIKMVFKK